MFPKLLLGQRPQWTDRRNVSNCEKEWGFLLFFFFDIHTFQNHPKAELVNTLTSADISATQSTGVLLLNLVTFKDSHVCSSNVTAANIVGKQKITVLTIINIVLVSFEMCYFTLTAHLLLIILINQDLKAK